MELQLKITGILLIVLGLLHIFFPLYFNWKEELSNLSLINKEMMAVHTFFVALVVGMMGVLSFFYSSELIKTTFGQHIALGVSFFWFCRLFIQFFVYSKALWVGKRFETIIHILFSIFWAYLTIFYGIIGI